MERVVEEARSLRIAVLAERLDSFRKSEIGVKRGRMRLTDGMLRFV